MSRETFTADSALKNHTLHAHFEDSLAVIEVDRFAVLGEQKRVEFARFLLQGTGHEVSEVAGN